jgi:hypothetical protein
MKDISSKMDQTEELVSGSLCIWKDTVRREKIMKKTKEHLWKFGDTTKRANTYVIGSQKWLENVRSIEIVLKVILKGNIANFERTQKKVKGEQSYSIKLSLHQDVL